MSGRGCATPMGVLYEDEKWQAAHWVAGKRMNSWDYWELGPYGAPARP
jgi:hypothetical protein